MTRLFLISGLGADERLFRNIDLRGYDLVPVKWLEPMQTDTLHTYAQKLVHKYHITEGTIVLGVSLGGMIAAEIAKLVKLKKAIILSSIKSSDEIPWYLKIFRFFPVYKFIPYRYFKVTGVLLKPFFGMKTKHDRWLFDLMLKSSSPQFMKWAINAILHWDSVSSPENVCHIIGDKDLVLPSRYIKEVTVLKGGTHMMVLDKAKQINQLIRECLST